MTAADWIAVGSAVAAVIAAILTWGQLRLQRSTARGDLQAQFDELVHKLSALVFQPPPPSDFSYAAEVQALVSQAAGLLGDGGTSKRSRSSKSFWRNRVLRRPVEEGPKADSFSCCVLAASYWVLGNAKSAVRYWDLGVKRSRGDPSTRVYALRGSAQFRYSLWRNDKDIDKGRKEFEKALQVFNVRIQGNDNVLEQNAYTLIVMAQCELGLGPGRQYEDKAVDCVERAWETQKGIVSISRRDVVTKSILEFAAQTGSERYKNYSDPELFKRAQAIKPKLSFSYGNWTSPLPSEQGAAEQDASVNSDGTGDGRMEDGSASG